jgi:hypothetical protein
MGFMKAERTQLYLRAALFGASGSGKSYSALRIAKGIAGKTGGRVAVIDTEHGSVSRYADKFDFDVDNLTNKDIDSYIDSMREAVRAGYKVLIIDSLTHAWDELLMEVDRIREANKNNSMQAWAKITPKQNRFIQFLISLPCHVIVTMRSKTEWFIGERNGRKVVEKVGLAPRQRDGIEYEFDFLLEIDQEHCATITKARADEFQDKIIPKPDEAFGESLYDWLVNPLVKLTGSASVNLTDSGTVNLTGNAPVNLPRDERRQVLLADIGEIVNAKFNDLPLFSDDELAEFRTRCRVCSYQGLEAIKAEVHAAYIYRRARAMYASPASGADVGIAEDFTDEADKFEKKLALDIF